MILDSCFIIDLLRGKSTAGEKMRELENSAEPIFITCISVFELSQGAKRHEDIEALNSFFDSADILPLDRESAAEAGAIFKGLKETGQIIDAEDAMIAGIALCRKQKVITRNLRHFSRIKKLAVESY